MEENIEKVESFKVLSTYALYVEIKTFLKENYKRKTVALSVYCTPTHDHCAILIYTEL